MNTQHALATMDFRSIPVNEEWSFKNERSTERLTHGYHRYPAKFLPNLVKKLIEKYTGPNEVVADVFAGCGTTLVEAKAHGRASVGVDINPVAELITRAKINPIDPILLEQKFDDLKKRIEMFDAENFSWLPKHERIDYWFDAERKQKIAFLYQRVSRLHNKQLRDFYLVALSNILKNCSRWLQSSTKPQIDPNKNPSEPFAAFLRQSRKMINKNKVFYEELKKHNYLATSCEIHLRDARYTGIADGAINAIITSPPYVTSYEYADIHQLTGLWYEYIANLPEFRRKFIGTFHSLNQSTETTSKIGQAIVNSLLEADKRTAKEVANYFNDMHDVAKEMNRVLAPEGHVCLVIGNTTYLNVYIKSAEVFTELLQEVGLTIEQIIKRSIPHKLMPTIRDNKTGKFAKLDHKDSKLVYPDEYIIVARKS